MTILFDLTPIYDHLTGIERYAINIAKSIILKHPENNYILVFKQIVHNEFIEFNNKDNIRMETINKCNKLLFHQFKMLFYLLKRKDIDFYFFLASPIPMLFFHKGIVSTVFDMTPWDCPETMRWPVKIYNKLNIKAAARKSFKIGTISQYSKERLLALTNTKKEKVFISYCGLSDIFRKRVDLSEHDDTVLKLYGIDGDYILCLSTLEPRKNMQLLIRAYSNLKRQGVIRSGLVLAGRKGWKLNDVIPGAEEFANEIVLTGFIKDEHLPLIYRNCDLFVFPSLYEGFGLPVIEAMSQGTVVISSDSSSLPEVGGKAAIFFKNNSLSALEDAITQYYKMPDEEKKIKKKLGIEQSRRFVWENEAEKYYNAIINA